MVSLIRLEKRAVCAEQWMVAVRFKLLCFGGLGCKQPRIPLRSRHRFFLAPDQPGLWLAPPCSTSASLTTLLQVERSLSRVHTSREFWSQLPRGGEEGGHCTPWESSRRHESVAGPITLSRPPRSSKSLQCTRPSRAPPATTPPRGC